jgi:hypothetical protein
MQNSNNRDDPNAREGADPSQEIKDQNPGETTTADLAEGEESKSKVEDVAKAGRKDFDPNTESPA